MKGLKWFFAGIKGILVAPYITTPIPLPGKVLYSKESSIEAISPESMENLRKFFIWDKEHALQAELLLNLSSRGISIYSNAFGIEGGVILPLFIPLKLFHPQSESLSQVQTESIQHLDQGGM